MSYVSEIFELQKMLKEIPPENLIEIATFKGRLQKVCKDYYFCTDCSNEKVACTCMGDDETELS